MLIPPHPTWVLRLRSVKNAPSLDIEWCSPRNTTRCPGRLEKMRRSPQALWMSMLAEVAPFGAPGLSNDRLKTEERGSGRKGWIPNQLHIFLSTSSKRILLHPFATPAPVTGSPPEQQKTSCLGTRVASVISDLQTPAQPRNDEGETLMSRCETADWGKPATWGVYS